MIVFTWVLPYYLIRLPDALSFKLYYLIDQSLDDSDAQIIILSPVIVVYDYKILVDGYQELLHIEFFNQSVHYFV